MFGLEGRGDGGAYHLKSAHKAAAESEQSSRAPAAASPLFSFPVLQEIVRTDVRALSPPISQGFIEEEDRG